MKSVGEETFWLHCQAYGLEPIREYRFHPKRQWRFDFYFPEKRIAVEIEGGTRANGRHNRHHGYEQDTYKYNAAALMGITVLRYTTGMVKCAHAIDEVRWALSR